MSDDEAPRSRLRIARWLPSYHAPDRATPAQPVSGPPPDGATDLAPPPAPPVAPMTAPGRTASRQRRLAVTGVTIVTAAVLLGVAFAEPGGVAPSGVDATAGPSAGEPQTIPSASESDLSGGPDAQPHGTTAADRGRATATPTAGRGSGAAPTRPSRPAAPPAGIALTPGARVGLEPATHPGYRVRHRNFAGRVDRIGASSGAVDRADATFTVRAGLAASGCLSFEAVNYPGYYLRHQEFRMHLHRLDGSRLFAADATFCPVTGLTGRHLSLRSYNYPDRYLHHRSGRLDITTVDGSDATRAGMTFIGRPPLA